MYVYLLYFVSIPEAKKQESMDPPYVKLYSNSCYIVISSIYH